MSKKVFLIVIILTITVAGLCIYRIKNNQKEDGATNTDEQISFICQDDNHFIAEFSSDTATLRIIVAGEVKYILPSLGDERVPHRFGNNGRTYTFVGEVVRVANLKTGERTVCDQPFDPNNAPYNFGEAEPTP